MIKTYLKKWSLAFFAFLAACALIYLYRKAAKLRDELKMLQTMEIRKRMEVEDAKHQAQADEAKSKAKQLELELDYLRKQIRAKDDSLIQLELAAKKQNDQILKAKSFAELEKLLQSSQEKTDDPPAP